MLHNIHRGNNFGRSMAKKRTSNVGNSRASVTVKSDPLSASKKRAKAKKWSKDKTRQKQKEVDDQVDAVYAVRSPSLHSSATSHVFLQAILPTPAPIVPDRSQDDIVAVNALAASLRGL